MFDIIINKTGLSAYISADGTPSVISKPTAIAVKKCHLKYVTYNR